MTKISKEKGIFYILLILFSLILWSCANIRYPDGGPTDKEPPVILKFIPPNGSINFHETRFELIFDEYIELKNLEENLIVSPPFENKPDIAASGKKLRFIFKDSLHANITYRIQFGNAIVDLNEANPLKNFEYVFSTGEFIDSLIIRGNVQNGFSHKPEANIYVVLYEDESFHDSIVSLQKPLYVTKTNTDGSFIFKHLKNSLFRILALRDLNSNLLYDLPTEDIGFKEELILPFVFSDSILIDSIPAVTINLFLQDDTVQRILFSDFIDEGILRIVTKFPVESLQTASIPKEICCEQNLTKDTLTVWLPSSEKDSIFLILKDAETIIDTVREKYFAEALDKKYPLPFFKSNISSIFPYYDLFSFEFLSPLIHFESASAVGLISKRDSIVFTDSFDTIFTDSTKTIIQTIDTITDTFPITVFDTIPVPYHLADSGCFRIFIIDIEPQQGEEYTFIVLGGKFTSIYGGTNDTILLKTKVSKEEDYGNFRFEFTGNPHSMYIIQLWDSKEERLICKNFIEGSDTLLYKYLTPGDYKLKLIEDKNKDKRWNSGNYWLRQQPEPVIYFNKTISVRANWDLEESFEWKE